MLLGGNNITGLDLADLRDLPRLRQLQLASNQLKTLSNSGAGAGAGSGAGPCLTQLDLSHNQLVVVQLGVLADLGNLASLNLSHNHLHTIIQAREFPYLKTFEIGLRSSM